MTLYYWRCDRVMYSPRLFHRTVLVMPVALNDTDRLVQAATIGTVPADGWALHGFQLPMLVLAIEPRLQADVPDHVEQKIVITVSYEARKNAVTVHGRNQQV